MPNTKFNIASVIEALWNIKYKGIGVLIIAILPIYLVDNYLDKHNECRIYKNNVRISLNQNDIVTSLNPHEMCAIISSKTSGKEYLNLSHAFFNKVHLGDTIYKMGYENTIWIKKGNNHIKVLFAQKPNKNCN